MCVGMGNTRRSSSFGRKILPPANENVAASHRGEANLASLMSKPVRKSRRRAVLLLAFAIATLVALSLAELTLRLVGGTPRVLGEISYADSSGTPVKDLSEAARRGLVVPVAGKKPRPRFMFKPGETFYIAYEDNDVLKRDWLDPQGRVINRINRDGLREREDIAHQKPAGQRRIVCLGDSFTFAWGIPVEQGWVRLLEEDLRTDLGDVRTINCGAAGTVCIDEYVNGLKQRFHNYDPDLVILTICLNDLIPSSGLGYIDPIPPTGLRLLDLARNVFGRSPLDLDPGRDWVQELLDLPEDQATAAGLVDSSRPFEAMWSQGVPQKSLREAKAYCDARGIPFLVVIWPFLQGLGPGRSYPFQKLHDLVASDCEAAGIPFLDVLPALQDTPQEDLWVTPRDPHANPLAQRLALPEIARFVRSHIND